MCFVDLEKAFDHVPRGILWDVLWEYEVRGPLLRAVRCLYNRSRSLVHIASCKSDLFPVHVGLRQGCPLSPVLFIVFMDRISRRSQGLEGVRFGDHRISSLIFADDVILLAPSSLDLQHALGRFAAECEAAGRVSTPKSEAMVLDRKKVACTLQVGGELLPQVEEFKYLGVLFASEGRMDREIDRWIGAAAAVMRSMYRSVVVKKELSRKAKLSIYQSIYVSTLTYGHELWVITERVRSRIQAAEMSFLCRVAGRSLRDRVRSFVTREELGVEPLLLHIKRGQLRWLGHLFRMPPGRLPGEVFRACPTGKRPRGRPRTCWRDYVSRLAWEHLGVSPEELEEISGEREGAGGNWATVGRRSRGGRRVHRQREKRKGKSVGLRIGTLNVGTMTGKGRELADMMERRKVDILCVQETRWKGSKARSIGAGFKLFYYGVDSKRNGVGVVLKEELVRNVLEVKRVSDRVMSLKLEIEGVMLNVVSGYAPQVGCELEEKERFWSELDEVMESIPTGERVVIGADFNGHVGEGNTGDEEVMGKFGVKERNLEGQMVVDFAKRMDMAVVNTYFQKREEHRVTYKSGGRRTQVDYILCRRGNLKEISDCKVVVGESVARQHRMVVCRMTLMICKKKRSETEKKTKWWKLKKEECCEEFRQKLRQALGGQVVLPDDWETTAEVIRETGRKVLGVSSGRRKEDKETWWWNEEVQDSIQRKRLAKKKWDMDRTEENRQEYKELQRRVKREVSKAKQNAYDELYTRLDTREGEKDLYRLARQRDRDGKDVQQVRVIKDRDGRVLTSEESVQRRWKEYFEELMNEENEREKRVEGVNSVEQKVYKIRKDEVRKALKRMKSGKAVGPDDIPVEVWKCLGEAAVEFLASLFNRVLESERMPEEWRRSVLVPIFKNKGDVQSCSNYRGIKLMSHTMKVWERVVEARLRKVVEICEQQYGFMPRKSTTDAIFALRILMEKYRDGQRELHCVFVDLEKVYDRVPREELWYCMRKSGVAEKYVRVVQDMYERSRTVVRCAVGQTEEFNVEVGLHQGSALSPFLFAIVMDQLSEEVRQESPWTMMFADDIVICSESREQVEENLERWRFVLERRGMKVSRSKTEYMCVNEREGSGTVRLQGEEVKKVQEFKYLGSTVQSNGECGKEENISENQGEGVQDSGETGHAVWFRDSVTEEETGVRARGSRAEDVEVLFGSDKIGQD
ncbi:hypothetical protein QTP70_001422 [Hemibagrus guttatus]|uniref:ribonuclease H n=2 Tax=Hemibagrus guttatus TaxID=175788 RepID=A0AAE0PTH8_9TELE|nr:hypothetical protein QTP70_001422 [Hemibagrus guttatus]KAK3524707.1 hypothetical protein QTP86_000988 [Hemibagrus guttatus]